MKNTYILVAIIAGLLMGGCTSSSPTSELETLQGDNDEHIAKFKDDIYIKELLYDGKYQKNTIYVFTDKDGNPFIEKPINIEEQKGKTTSHHSVMNDIPQLSKEKAKYYNVPREDNIEDNIEKHYSKTKYNFKCDTLEECEQKIKIVRETIIE